MSLAEHNPIADAPAPGIRLRGGFTLVELLVVIALITVLVAVIVPVTVQSRNRARAVACMSNLRQLGSAVLVYCEDTDDGLPLLNGTAFSASAPKTPWPEGTSATSLRQALAKYVKNAGVYKCGNDSGAPEYGFDTAGGSVYGRTGSSYTPWSTARAGLYGIRMNGSKVSACGPSSGCCLMRDYGSDWHGYLERDGLNVEKTTVANAAFADGHAASVKAVSVSVSDRAYICYSLSGAGTISISGGSGDVQVDLSGRLRSCNDESGQQRTQISVSGTVSGGDGRQNVDRIFTMGADTRLDTAFRQIVAWADGLAAR